MNFTTNTLALSIATSPCALARLNSCYSTISPSDR